MEVRLKLALLLFKSHLFSHENHVLMLATGFHLKSREYCIILKSINRQPHSLPSWWLLGFGCFASFFQIYFGIFKTFECGNTSVILIIKFVPSPANSFKQLGMHCPSMKKDNTANCLLACRLVMWDEMRPLPGTLGSRDGAVVRAFASHQCGPGSIPGLGVICGLGLLLVFVLAPRGFPPGTSVYPLLKNQHFKIPLRSGKCPHLVLCAKYIDT